MGYENKPHREFDNTNSGILFKNDRKETEKHPDYKGSINIDGRDYWLSGWKKETQKGPALSLKVQPKVEARRQDFERGRQDATASRADLNDPIDF